MSLAHFVAPLAGGVLIGGAALLLYAAVGRIAGVSGIAYGGIWAGRGDRLWRWIFLVALVGGGALAIVFGAPHPVASPVPWALPLIGGLLVGAGTRLGNGCTSGHGVCGLGRLSPRSLAAVVVFMALGMLTATLLRPVFL
jgi:uncharacterized membrane protein YedE/YeeE